MKTEGNKKKHLNPVQKHAVSTWIVANKDEMCRSGSHGWREKMSGELGFDIPPSLYSRVCFAFGVQFVKASAHKVKMVPNDGVKILARCLLHLYEQTGIIPLNELNNLANQ